VKGRNSSGRGKKGKKGVNLRIRVAGRTEQWGVILGLVNRQDVLGYLGVSTSKNWGAANKSLQKRIGGSRPREIKDCWTLVIFVSEGGHAMGGI